MQPLVYKLSAKPFSMNMPRKHIWVISRNIFFLCLMIIPNNSAADDNKPFPVVVVPQQLSSPEAGGYVGADKCLTCHPAQFEKWRNTPHAKAFATLYKEGRQSPQPSCLRCHTTGYGELGGFDNPTDSARLAGVQCEACHGPGSRHLKDVKLSGWDAVSDCVDCQLRKVCMACHPPKHSPDFDFEAYLAKVTCASD